MKGLLLKDFYLMIHYCRAFLLMILLFAGIAVVGDESMFFILYPCLIAGMISMTLYSYDEREKWTAYAGTLPYTKAQLVSAKYGMGLIANMLILVLVAITQAVRMIGNASFSLNEYLLLLVLAAATGLIGPTILMPFVFRYGAEKGRIMYYIVIGVCCAASTSLLNVDRTITFRVLGIREIACIGLGAVLLYAMSWMLSIACCKKREI